VAGGEGETATVRIDYTEVPPAELEGLDEIIERIARSTGVRFIAARVHCECVAQ
jgi:hypothetical protein